jgi:hypothetical protein
VIFNSRFRRANQPPSAASVNPRHSDAGRRDPRPGPLRRFQPGQTPIDEAARRSPRGHRPASRLAPRRARRDRTAPPQPAPRRPYEAAAQFWPAYLRGQADLAEGAGAEAAAQFQYIIDHRGQEPTSPRYPLAHLGLSRAARLNSDTAKSRQAYQNFFALRKESDAYLTELIAARREHEEME